MSSLRNAVKRITHKERSQPTTRAHLGLLEKKKDYKERANDTHRKNDRVQALSVRAANRNPDEFYFGMHNSQMQNGKHIKTLRARHKEMEDQIGAEAVRIMKDQDLSHVRMQCLKEQKKVERLQSSLHLVHSEEGAIGRKHTIFTDQTPESFDVAGHFQTVPEMANRAFNRRRLSDLRIEVEASQSKALGAVSQENKGQHGRRGRRSSAAKKVARARSNAYAELNTRLERMQAMRIAEAHLVTEKLVGSKGRKRKVRDAENGMPAQYKWRRKRAK